MLPAEGDGQNCLPQMPLREQLRPFPFQRNPVFVPAQSEDALELLADMRQFGLQLGLEAFMPRWVTRV